MASHFTDIGFPSAVDEDGVYQQLTLLALLTQAKGEPLVAKSGLFPDEVYYACLHVAEGIELWGVYDPDDCIVGINPHFAGKSAILVGIDKLYPEQQSICAWTLDREEDGYYAPFVTDKDGSGLDEGRLASVPILFDVPDFGCYPPGLEKTVQMLQLTGFAHHLARNPNANKKPTADFSQTAEPAEPSSGSSQALHPNGLWNIADKAYFPVGLYDVRPEEGLADKDHPKAYAVLSGYVLKLKKIVNPMGKGTFYWALLEIFENARVDIVFDPILLPDLKVGDCVQGYFWLSGRLLGFRHTPRQLSLLTRFKKFLTSRNTVIDCRKETNWPRLTNQ